MKRPNQYPFFLTGQLRIGSGGASSALSVQDEGVLVESNVTVLNFIGADVQALAGGGAGTVSIYIPPPAFASHWNTTDGTTNGTVSESISRSTARISTPTSEANPFSTGGWADSNQSASTNTTVTFTTAGGQAVTGFGGNATFTVTVYDANGSSVLETYTTPALTGDGTNTSGSGFIAVTLSSYAADTTRFKAVPSITVQINNLLTANSRSGGRYNVLCSMTADTGTDSGTYPYTQPAVFLDSNPTTPSIGGTVTIAETGGSVTTKHLSGIEYYTTGSQFTLTVNDIDQLNRNTARTSQNLRVTATNYGISTLNQSPLSGGSGASKFSGYTNGFNQDNVTYQNTSGAISSSNFRYRGTDARVSAFPRDTWASGGTINSVNASILVDTYGTTSTDLIENFDDENRRQASNYNTGSTTGNWNSTTSLSAGEALVLGGQLLIPNQATLTNGSSNSNFSSYAPTAGGANPNYSALGATVSYYRAIVDSTGLNRSSFTVVFSGTFVANATTDLLNENLKMFVRRRASANGGNAGYNTAYPLLVHGALYNFAAFDDGVTNGQIREASSSGNTVNCTFGGFTCETGFFVEIQIANTAIKLDSFSVTFF